MSKILHIGCGFNKIDGFINTDKQELDLLKTFPYEDSEIDAIVSSHVLQEFYWRDLVHVFSEMKRVLKDDGVVRICSPHTKSGFKLDVLLGWGNVNLFNADILSDFSNLMGFRVFATMNHGKTLSKHADVIKIDNREEESIIYEIFKTKKGLHDHYSSADGTLSREN